jgi:hypothetical protein
MITPLGRLPTLHIYRELTGIVKKWLTATESLFHELPETVQVVDGQALPWNAAECDNGFSYRSFR